MAETDNSTSSAAGSSSATSSSSSLSSSAFYYMIPTIRYVSAVWISMPIAIVGIIGNILSIVVLGRRKRRYRQALASSATIGLAFILVLSLAF